MTEFAETDISYLRGQIEGLIIGIARHTPGDKEFDNERWEELYGSQVLYSSFPYYPNEEAGRNDEGGLVLCNWDDETETRYLKEGVDLPDDRAGTMVFEDGTVVKTTASSPKMFVLNDRDTGLVETWDQRLLDTVREVYDYSAVETE